jgi:hypothetical protein
VGTEPTPLARRYSRTHAFGCVETISGRDTIAPKMRVIVSASATEAINEKGGRLYVWLRSGQCCRGTTTLDAATTPPAGREFRREKAATSFELYLPAHLAQLPTNQRVLERLRLGRLSRKAANRAALGARAPSRAF